MELRIQHSKRGDGVELRLELPPLLANGDSITTTALNLAAQLVGLGEFLDATASELRTMTTSSSGRAKLAQGYRFVQF